MPGFDLLHVDGLIARGIQRGENPGFTKLGRQAVEYRPGDATKVPLRQRMLADAYGESSQAVAFILRVLPQELVLTQNRNQTVNRRFGEAGRSDEFSQAPRGVIGQEQLQQAELSVEDLDFRTLT